MGLSWAVERRLRRQHAAMCADWERRRQQALPLADNLAAVLTPPTSNPPSIASSIIVSDDVHDQDKRTSLSGRATDSALPGSSLPRAQLMAYRAFTTTSFLSVKVRQVYRASERLAAGSTDRCSNEHGQLLSDFTAIRLCSLLGMVSRLHSRRHARTGLCT